MGRPPLGPELKKTSLREVQLDEDRSGSGGRLCALSRGKGSTPDEGLTDGWIYPAAP